MSFLDQFGANDEVVDAENCEAPAILSLARLTDPDIVLLGKTFLDQIGAADDVENIDADNIVAPTIISLAKLTVTTDPDMVLPGKTFLD